MRYRRLLLAVFLLGAAGFGLYLYKYHSLAVEGWLLFNDRCNTVNPLLIKVRNTHLGLGAARSGQATLSAKQFEDDLTALPDLADQYIKQEKIWLENQGAYINRWDFRLLEPGYMQDASKYQLAMYQGYYDYYKTISDFFRDADEAKATGNEFNGEDTPGLMSKYYNDMLTNKQLYFQAFDKGQKTRDWKKVFAQVPPPDCPEKNIHIPEQYSP